MDNLLSILTFIPLLAALILAVFLRGDDEAAQRNAKWLAVTATGATLLVALILWSAFDASMDGFQYVEERSWPLGLKYRMGVDGISLGFIVTVTALAPLAVAASWRVADRVRDYVIALLTAETFLLGAFLSLDLAFFVVFFEGASIPVLLLAGFWGSKGAGHAAFKAFLYALPGMVLLVVALAALARNAVTTDISALLRHNFPDESQTLILLGLAWAIAVKLPLWPLHAWLPPLVARAPAAVTLVLTGMSATLGLYLLMRFALLMLPLGVIELWPYAIALVLITFVLAALAAYVQERVTQAIGYLAIATMMLPVLAALSLTAMGLDAAILGVVARGLTLAGLLLALTVVEVRLRSDAFEYMGGIRLRLPGFGILLMLFCLASFGLPGTPMFPALALGAFGSFATAPWLTLTLGAGALGLAAIGAGLYRQIALGDLLREDVRTMPAMDGRERLALLLAAGALLVMGLAPSLILEPVGASTAALAEIIGAEIAEASSVEVDASQIDVVPTE
ncbi:MAG: NADH-quinone oxidoreductase subunit M [Rhodobacteraceae bacterium]|nr:NADH-quinone oxidoreductase subunit M [Paracoccaceae bacterium]